MTLNQFQDLRLWHLRHAREQPLERHCWDMVLTLWMIGWIGGLAALVLQQNGLALASLLLLFLPQRYVAWRRRLHRGGRLRCDWLDALR
jgi:hypothetical protein